MVRLEQKVQPHAQVVDTELESGEIVLLHLDSTTYFSLNLTGAKIWLGVKQGLTLQEISQRLQATFEVEPTRADQSVLSLVDELLQQQIVQPRER
jgi:hypothetical protein